MSDLTLYEHESSGAYLTAASPADGLQLVWVSPAQGVWHPQIPFASTMGKGALCFLAKMPSNWSAFVNQIRKSHTSPPAPLSWVIWIEDPDTDPIEFQRAFQIREASENQYQISDAAVVFPFRNATVTVPRRSMMGVDDAGTGLSFTPPDGADIVLGAPAASSSLDVSLTSVTLQLGATEQGLLTFDAAFTEADLDALDVGLRYLWTQVGTNEYCSPRYPVFQLPNSETVAVQGRLDPFALSDPDRTCYRFPTTAPAATASYLSSLLGHTVTLTPRSDADPEHLPGLRFEAFPANGSPLVDGVESVYLAPVGDFVLGVEDDVGTGDRYRDMLLGGLSGTEYFSTETPASGGSGTVLRFVPARAAASIYTPARDADAPPRFGPLTEDGLKTSWVSIGPGGSADATAYFSEPDDGPFFSESAGAAAGRILDYFPVTLTSLASADGPVVPLVPYGHATVPDVPGVSAKVDSLEAFEFQIVNPTRRDALETASAPVAGTPALVAHADLLAPAPPDGVAITPGGSLSRFDKGEWNLLRFGEVQVEGEDTQWLDFGEISKPAVSIPKALQEAFLTNQQFTVISSAANLGTMTPSVTLSGWTFDLKPPDTQAVGDYQNVMIFKSASGTLADLAADPSTWTGYDAFNDTTYDREGEHLSRWILDYIDQARSIYADGEGATSFQNFCTLVDDPDWTGFVVLKATIPLDRLPEAIKALSAGIDLSRFYCHHIGNEVTQVTPWASATNPPVEDKPLGLTLKSAVFALVYYEDPAYEEARQAGASMPLIETINGTYDFRVLSLIVTFAKSVRTGFSAKLELIATELFGAEVATITPSSESGEELPPATNRILLDGSVHRQDDGSSAYTFATPKNESATFYLGERPITTVTVTYADFVVVHSKGPSASGSVEPITTRFDLAGSLEFGGQLPLDPSEATDTATSDLFSYRYLEFSGLAIEQDFDLDTTDSPPSTKHRVFTFDTERLALSGNEVHVLAKDDDPVEAGLSWVRNEAWMAQFPLKLTGFVDQTGKKDPRAPDTLGYGPITTLPFQRNGVPKLGDAWYGLTFDLGIGTMGALANNSVMTAEILLAWGLGDGSVYLGMQLPGLGPIQKLVDIDGVLTFGAEEVRFDRVLVEQEDDTRRLQYVLEFASIGFSLFVLHFPAKGSTNVVLFGDPDGQGSVPPSSLGWFGSYVKPDWKPTKPTGPTALPSVRARIGPGGSDA